MLDVKLVLNACGNNMNNDNRSKLAADEDIGNLHVIDQVDTHSFADDESVLKLAECCIRDYDCDDTSVAIEDTHTTNFPPTDLNEAATCLSINGNEFVKNRSGKCPRDEENILNVGYSLVRILDGNNIVSQPSILSEDHREQRQSQQQQLSA